MTTQMKIRKMGYSRRQARKLLRLAEMYWKEAKRMMNREYSAKE